LGRCRRSGIDRRRGARKRRSIRAGDLSPAPQRPWPLGTFPGPACNGLLPHGSGVVEAPSLRPAEPAGRSCRRQGLDQGLLRRSVVRREKGQRAQKSATIYYINSIAPRYTRGFPGACRSLTSIGATCMLLREASTHVQPCP
jgi:hypothetical protein